VVLLPETINLIGFAEEKKDSSDVSTRNSGKKLRFVQLYTSKSYANRRPMLVRPTDEEENYNVQVNGSTTEDSTSDLEKHVLSPTLVDAISKTAQFVWAHTKKMEGLTGRSDIRLQTAVGMPVAVDKDGNMCVVVMFSPNNIQSTDSALEYLQNISRSATSTSSFPALLPAFDPKQGLISLDHHHHSSQREALPLLSHVLSDGVVTRFVPLDENSIDKNQPLSLPEVHSDQDLESAPRDCFGIPMLPAIAELGNSIIIREDINGGTSSDPFDEASYGVWSTIMQTVNNIESINVMEEQESGITIQYNSVKTQILTKKSKHPYMNIERQQRLEEFASAFLDVSIFDLAEVWIPTGQNSDCLGLNSSVKTVNNNALLNEFATASGKCLIKFWSGAVGRAYSSGNPVWSFNQEVFSDTGRLHLLQQAKVETVLAVPVFSGRSKTPAFVFCCYSFVRSGSVPFVLKFVQQALKLLWAGLDNVQLHDCVGEDVWKHIAPADLGEMAVDVEMHQHFMIKKRSIGVISNDVDSRDESLKSLTVQIVPSIYTRHEPPLEDSSPQLGQSQTYGNIKNKIHDAIKAVADINPTNQHITTNANGSKRAHIFVLEPNETSTPPFQQQPQPQLNYHHQQQHHHLQQYQYYHQQQPLLQQHSVKNPNLTSSMRGTLPAVSTPLPLPHPFPLPNQIIRPLNNEGCSTDSQQTKKCIRSLQEKEPLITMYESTQSRLIDSNTELNDALQEHHNDTVSSYSISSMQQIQPDPLPTPVYSIPIEQVKAAGTLVSATLAPSVVNEVDHTIPPNSTFRSATPGSCVRPVTVTLSTDSSKAKRCRIQGCDKTALARRPYCVCHSGNRMCEHEGCSKCAQGSTRFCIAHGGGRRCTFPGCDKGARDKFFCAAHGGGKRCKFEGCTKSAVGSSNLCTAHGGGRRCDVEGCDKSAQSSTKFCVKHGGGKKCSHPECEKVSRGRTQFCAGHGGGVRCKLTGCNRVAIGKIQLCRAHGGGTCPKNTLGIFSSKEVMLPLVSSICTGSGSIQGGNVCVPIIEPVMYGFGHPQQQQEAHSISADLASI